MREVLTVSNGLEVCMIGDGLEYCVVPNGLEVCRLGLPAPAAVVDNLAVWLVNDLTMTVNQLDDLL